MIFRNFVSLVNPQTSKTVTFLQIISYTFDFFLKIFDGMWAGISAAYGKHFQLVFGSIVKTGN